MIEVKVSFETASNSCIDLFERIQEGDASSKESKRTSKSLEKLKKYFSTSKEQTPSVTVCDGDSCKIVEDPSSGMSLSKPLLGLRPKKLYAFLQNLKVFNSQIFCQLLKYLSSFLLSKHTQLKICIYPLSVFLLPLF